MATTESTSDLFGLQYAPKDPMLQKPWEVLIDGSTGLLCYWNRETNLIQYEKPSALAPPPASTPNLASIPMARNLQPNSTMHPQPRPQMPQQRPGQQMQQHPGQQIPLQHTQQMTFLQAHQIPSQQGHQMPYQQGPLMPCQHQQQQISYQSLQQQQALNLGQQVSQVAHSVPHSLGQKQPVHQQGQQPQATQSPQQQLQYLHGPQGANQQGQQIGFTEGDAILSSILPLMETREAVRTSILSRKWRNAWKVIPNVTFNSYNMLKNDLMPRSTVSDLHHCRSSRKMEAMFSESRNKLVDSTNEFLLHYQGSRVNLFGIAFHLNREHSQHLDNWVDFAIRSEAKKLVLLLNDSSVPISKETEPYNFPFHLFDNGRGSSVESIRVSYCGLSPHATFTGFSSLRSISLHSLQTTDMQIDNLLSHCLVIESLSFKFCIGLANLNVSQRSGRLKSLTIFNCSGLLKIELDSIVLTVFEYFGKWPILKLKNASRVVNAAIRFDDGQSSVTDPFVPKLLNEIPQLEGFSLGCDALNKVGLMSNSYKFTHLKKLVLFTSRSCNYDAFDLAPVLNSAPLLEEFHVHIFGFHFRNFRPERHIPDMPHLRLKQFEFGGFDGWEDEMKFVVYVMRNAITLELVVVDGTPYNYSFTKGWTKLTAFQSKSANSEHSRLEAFQNLSQTPRLPGVKLVLR